MDQIEKIRKQIDQEVTAHGKTADRWKSEALIWKFILICITFGCGILTVFSEFFTPVWYAIIAKIYTGAVIPLFTSLAVWRNCDVNESIERRIAASKRMVLDVINAESLKPEQLRDQPDDFYKKISAMMEIIERNS